MQRRNTDWTRLDKFQEPRGSRGPKPDPNFFLYILIFQMLGVSHLFYSTADFLWTSYVHQALITFDQVGWLVFGAQYQLIWYGWCKLCPRASSQYATANKLALIWSHLAKSKRLYVCIRISKNQFISQWMTPFSLREVSRKCDFCKKKIKFATISTSSRKIWWRSDDPRPSYLRIFYFQNGGRPHGFDRTSYRTTHDLYLMVLTSS